MTNDQNTNDPRFVFVCALDGAGGSHPVATQTAEPRWYHLDYTQPDAREALSELGLGTGLIDSLTRPDSRPRTLALPGGILVILRGVNTNAGADTEDMVSLRLWIEPERLISVRQRRLLSVQDIQEELGQEAGPRTVAELVVRLIQRLADRIAGFVDQLEDRIEAFEDTLDAGASHEVRAGLSTLRRQTAKVRRFLAPQREALEGLARQARETLGEGCAAALREQSDRIARYVEDLDLVRERAMVLQEELLNRNVEQQNARMYVLAILSAIFLPITFITGLFGMNVAGLPGTRDGHAFAIVMAIMAAALVVVVALMRRKRWF
ncbi:MAG: zinc transporter ZntB [Gammaproteobacteria bacterium]|nr:zinc transporter ZntB [Gammaproteobacteria bacterium]